MRWKNSKKDQLPKDQQKVLVSIDGITYSAKFDKNKACFNAETPEKKTYKIGDHDIYWSESLENREREQKGETKS